MTNQTPWREFERLVTEIESAAAPRGARVTSPDRLRDLITGRVREVDASIRYRVGTVDVLITIECRTRSRVADDTWIEQLATKRAKIGAAKTIAVSNIGFSSSAHRTAQLNGIELRTLKEVAPTEVEDWFLPSPRIVHLLREAGSIECVFFLEYADGASTDFGLTCPDVFEPVLHHDLIQSPFPPALLFLFLELHEREKFEAVPLDGTVVPLVFLFKVTPGTLLLQGREGRLIVHHVRMSADVNYAAFPVELTDGTHYRYEISAGQSVDRSSFVTQMFGHPARIDHQRGPDGRHHVSWQVLPRSTSSASDEV